MNFHKLALWLGIVPLALGASLFAACGGDDDDDGGSSGGGTGSDEDFVSGLCKSSADFLKDLESAQDDIDPEDFDEAAKALAEPFEDFANDFKKLKPPSDLKEWHKQASDGFDDLIDDLNDGNFETALEGNPIPEFPESAKDRLTKIAEDNDDCKDAGGFIG